MKTKFIFLLPFIVFTAKSCGGRTCLVYNYTCNKPTVPEKFSTKTKDDFPPVNIFPCKKDGGEHNWKYTGEGSECN